MCECLIHRQRYEQQGYCVYCGDPSGRAAQATLDLWAVKPSFALTSASTPNVLIFPVNRPEGA